MKTTKFIIITLLILTNNKNAFSSTFTLSEKSISVLAKSTNAPRINMAKAELLQAQENDKKFDEIYSSSITLNSSWSKTNEKARYTFYPIISPIRVNSLNYSKYLGAGTSTSINVFSDTSTISIAGSKNNTTLSYANLNLNFDLWKNIFGKLDSLNKDSLNLKHNEQLLTYDLKRYQYHLSLRKVYWKIFTKIEAIEVTQKLLKASKDQLKIIKKRFKQNVSDRGDVAKSKSIVSSREGQLLFLQYQKEILIEKLKALAPDIADKNINIEIPNVNMTIIKVMECINSIKKYKTPPLHFTSLDEIDLFLSKSISKQILAAKRDNMMDIKLSSQLGLTGTGSNIDKVIEDISDNDRSKYSVALNVNIPIGSSKSQTIDKKVMKLKSLESVSRGNMLGTLKSVHQSTVKSIGLLFEAIAKQQSSQKDLVTQINSIQKKYSQGRVTLNQLINEEQSLLNLELQIIETRTVILETLFHYFQVFNETQCSFNHKI